MWTKPTDKLASEVPAEEVDVAQAIGALPFRSFHYLQIFAVMAVFLGAGTTTASLSWIEDDVRAQYGLTPAQELPIVFTSLSAVTLGLFTAGATSDQLGRRVVCLAGLWALLAFQMSIGAAQSPAAVAVCFGLRGFALHFGEDVAKGYLAEVLPAKGRGKVLNLMHAAWQLGGILFSCITLFTTAYAPLAVLSCLPVLLALALFLSVTIESPLWLDKNRGHAAGLRQLRRMYAKCHEPWPYDAPGMPTTAASSSASLSATAAAAPADSSSAPLLAKPGGKDARRYSDGGGDSERGEGGGAGWCCCPGGGSGGSGSGGSGGSGSGSGDGGGGSRGCPCGPSRVWACLRRAYGPLLGEHRKLTGLITLLYIALQLGTVRMPRRRPGHMPHAHATGHMPRTRSPHRRRRPRTEARPSAAALSHTSSPPPARAAAAAAHHIATSHPTATPLPPHPTPLPPHPTVSPWLLSRLRSGRTTRG